MLAAIWTEENIALILTVVVLAVKHVLDELGRRQNRTIMQDVQTKVNGNLVKAVNQAKEEARRETAPRVLVVDDDDNDLVSAKLCLKKFGVDVFTARTANEAEQLLMSNIGPGRGYPFDFVLLDLKMPGENVEDVFRTFTLRAPKVPLVILTGQMQAGGTTADFANLPRMWIEKPLKAHHVKHLLEQFGVPYHLPDPAALNNPSADCQI